MKRVFISLLLILPLLSCGNSSEKKADSTEETSQELMTKSKPGSPKKSKSSSTQGGKVLELTLDGFNSKIADLDSDEWEYLGDRPAIIDFYATWCGPCKQMTPIMEELAAEYKDDIIIYKVDVDKEPELAQMFGINSIPVFLFMPMEGLPQLAEGANTKDVFENIIREVLEVD